MDEKLVYFGFGALLGAVMVGLYTQNQNAKKTSSFLKEKDGMIREAKDDGYNEAHENFEQLLLWGHQRGYSPAQLIPVIRGEN